MKTRSIYWILILSLLGMTLACNFLTGTGSENPPTSVDEPAPTEPVTAPEVVTPESAPVETLAPTTVSNPAISGETIRQWASSAIASSEYGDESWAAEQAAGAPNVLACGDDTSAWASATASGVDWLELTFTNPVKPSQINIVQSYSPSSVVKVEVFDLAGESHIIYTAEPEQKSECPFTLKIDIADPTFSTNRVRISVDQQKISTWNEIDAVELVGESTGETAPVITPSIQGSVETEFPLPSTLSSLMVMENGSVNYQTDLTLDEVMEFYRQELTAKSLTEREILTVVSDTTFSMVFDGSPNGQAVVIQGVDLGNGATNVNIRYEDV